MDSEFSAVSTRAELERFLEDVRFSQSASVARMNHLAGQVRAQQKLKDLLSAQQRLNGSVPSAAAASALFQSACDSGSATKDRVNDVLLVYERAKAAREMADQIINLRSSIQGIYGAMEVRDWERAAQLAQRARDIPEEISGGELANRMVPTAELPSPPLTSLRAACEDLSNLFTREFKQATSQRQMDQVTRYFKLFPLVGYEDQGLKLYAEFVCHLVAGLSRRLLSSAEQSTRQNPTFYAVVLTRLFENVAAVIDQHSRVVSRHYGPDAMPLKVMPLIQVEIDKQVGLILDTFWDERRVETLLANCKNYDFPFLVNTFTSTSTGTGTGTGSSSNNNSNDSGNSAYENDTALNDTSDLQEASARLSELGTMLNRWSLYRSFVLHKWGSHTGNQNEDDDKSRLLLLRSLDESSTVGMKIAEILSPTYSTLALFVFRRSVERAVQLDELPTQRAIDANPKFTMEAPLVSSAVDDTMYVFSNMLAQALEAGDVPTQLSAITAFRRVLESDLIGTLQRKLRNSAPVDSIPTGGDFGGAGVFMVYLNDLEVCAQYVKETIEKNTKPAVPDGKTAGSSSSSIPEEVAKPLNKFRESFQNRASELLLDGCQTLTAKRISLQVRTIVSSSFKAAAYTTQVETGRCGVVFREQWHKFVKPLQKLLHPNILAHILTLVLPTVSQQLERFVWGLNGKLSESGAMSLDRDISIVIAAGSETQYSLRHHFVKLAQIVNALTDRDIPPEDLNALTTEERTQLLAYRIVKG